MEQEGGGDNGAVLGAKPQAVQEGRNKQEELAWPLTPFSLALRDKTQ